MKRVAWGALCLGALAGCTWELPKPRVRDAGVDARPADVTDVPVGMDALPDVPVGVDVPARDVPAVDVPTVVDVPVDTGVDVPVALDLGVPDVMVGECVPNTRRPCYTGTAASRARGLCRDGVNVCDRTGMWGATCEAEILPDCLGRECGGDDCGSSCGVCPTGTGCDDQGHCNPPACGTMAFTVMCPDGTRCPTSSACVTGGRCLCNAGYVGVDCSGVACGATCTYPNWSCQPQPFCGTGSFLCPMGTVCPRHSSCDTAGRCVCNAGFVAVTCTGVRCNACPGTNYHCIPGPLP